MTASSIVIGLRLFSMDQCDHKNQLIRQHRNLWDKLSGVKEVYMCKKCGKIIKLRGGKMTSNKTV